MFNYFVHFTFIHNGNLGNGNVDVMRSDKVTGIDDVRIIEGGILDNFGYESVVISSFKLFDKD